MSHSYQLTKHPVGSKREFWALSWPLMIGLISSCLMMFVDRLFLSHYSPLALNAAASAGIAYWVFLVMPMGVAAISEVLVGRLHGEDNNKEIGAAAWQMLWFGLILTPLFWVIGSYLSTYIFAGTGNEVYEIEFFETLMYFAPAQCMLIALSGFFIGIGNVKIVTIAALLTNFINILLDYILIFGWGPFPEMGVTGAALGTGVAMAAQCVILFYFFLSKDNREKYATSNFSFRKSYFFDGIKIGGPSGVGHCMEIIAHFIFFRLVMSMGQDQMTIVVMVQSLYMLAAFVSEAQSKAASAIVANLLGANVTEPISRVLKSAFTLHGIYFFILMGAIGFFPDAFLQIFASQEHHELLASPIQAQIFTRALYLMCFFFLLDGWSWILIGFLTAAGDTRYIFWVGTLVNWVGYILPTVWLIGWYKGGADVAWGIVAFMSLITFISYYSRYHTSKWLKSYQPLTA